MDLRTRPDLGRLPVNDTTPPTTSPVRNSPHEKDVEIAGGASAVRQCLAAGLLDELVLHLTPAVLGAGERLFDDLAELAFTPTEVISSPTVTHLRYRTARHG
ncbi:dihydrofolate reductase family protein [Streptomyces sp. NPDC002491]